MFRSEIIGDIDIDTIKNIILNDLISIKNEVNGIDNILYLLNNSDYFTAPASTKYHLSCPHGLMIHSYNVTQNMLALNELYQANLPKRTIYICGYLHDINKINSYVETNRNIKISNKWIKIKSYNFEKDGIQGHGDLSVIMLLKNRLEMTDDEIAAIQMHMGAFHYGHSWETTQQLTNTYLKYDAALLLHLSDMVATYRNDVLSEHKFTDEDLLSKSM